MDKKQHKTQKSSALEIAVLLFFVAFANVVVAQSGLYVPSNKPVRDMKKALTNPECFYLVLHHNASQSAYSTPDLDLLDSAYRIAFDQENPMYYTMTIEGYGGSNESLTRQRVDAVYRYFAMRCRSNFPIRYAKNKIHCSCKGDTTEVLRFEVPVSTMVYKYSELPEARRMLNKSIDLAGCVLVTFRNNPDECVGSARGCFVPEHDTLLHGYYASMLLSKGSLYAVQNTKDTCPSDFSVKIDDHLDYRALLDAYHLIPHRKQVLAMAGYIVISSRLPVSIDSCSETQRDSVFIRIPATQEQLDAKLRFFAKVKTSRGMEYKALPTRKLPGKGQLTLQAPINITQFDTIYLGKRLQDKEVGKYFYEVDSPTEAASFAVGNRFYVASKPGKNGEPQMKKPLKQLFRIIPDQEDEVPAGKTQVKNPDEIIED